MVVVVVCVCVCVCVCVLGGGRGEGVKNCISMYGASASEESRRVGDPQRHVTSCRVVRMGTIRFLSTNIDFWT